MKNKNAFTLIEVMVVLSILALVAVLAYSFLGGVVREAQVKHSAVTLYNYMQKLSEAWEMYEMDTGNTVAASECGDTFVASGHLKGLPHKPDTGFFGSKSVRCEPSAYNFGGPSTAKDPHVTAYNIDDELCLAFNELYAGISTIPTVPSYLNLGGYSVVCYHNTGLGVGTNHLYLSHEKK